MHIALCTFCHTYTFGDGDQTEERIAAPLNFPWELKMIESPSVICGLACRNFMRKGSNHFLLICLPRSPKMIYCIWNLCASFSWFSTSWDGMSFRKVSLCSIWVPWKMEFYFPFPFLKFHEWNIGTQEIQVEASSFTYVPLCIPYDKYQIILTKTMANIVVNI